MNEPMTKEYGYLNVVSDKTCKVSKRMVEGCPVILIKCIANIPYNKDTVFESIANLEIRKQWDSVFSELKVVNYEGENGDEILYMIVKSPMFIVLIGNLFSREKCGIISLVQIHIYYILLVWKILHVLIIKNM